MPAFRAILFFLLRLSVLTLVQILATAGFADDGAPILPEEPFRYGADGERASSDYAFLDSTAKGNPVTDTGATLGRVLFYDRNLSANGLVSCASCHTQATAFDDASRRSIGFRGQITPRAAMSLVNARYNRNNRYFRDERAESLQQQVLIPFTDTVEMGLKPGQLVSRVRSKPWYRDLFAAAFGDARITEQRIAAALTQFVRAIVADKSRYDTARSSTDDPLLPFPIFSALENRGKHLFFADMASGGAGCAACHATDAFVLVSPQNNGLDEGGEPTADPGVGGITGREEDIGLFRTASLKNIALTAPYMHDGRFADLAAVIDHYSRGIRRHPNLSARLRRESGEPVAFDFSDYDKMALIAFLHTLTDNSLLEDPRFSDPFVEKEARAIAE